MKTEDHVSADGVNWGPPVARWSVSRRQYGCCARHFLCAEGRTLRPLSRHVGGEPGLVPDGWDRGDQLLARGHWFESASECQCAVTRDRYRDPGRTRSPPERLRHRSRRQHVADLRLDGWRRSRICIFESRESRLCPLRLIWRVRPALRRDTGLGRTSSATRNVTVTAGVPLSKLGWSVVFVDSADIANGNVGGNVIDWNRQLPCGPPNGCPRIHRRPTRSGSTWARFGA